MIVLVWAFFGTGVGSIVWCIWSLWSNNRTYKDRMKIISIMHKYGWPKYLRENYEQVSYNQHLWQRKLCRDPMKLYSLEMQTLFYGKPVLPDL